MKYLMEKELDNIIVSLKQPVLGICLGLQLMCRYSEEGGTVCMKIFDSDVKLFPRVDKVPHMGWNNFFSVKGEIFRGISPKDNVYYVHSYYPEISSCTTAVCDYIVPFSAGMKKDNFYAVQFHPEKSALTGENILRNFLEL
jgi:glutamine amidotransferase